MNVSEVRAGCNRALTWTCLVLTVVSVATAAIAQEAAAPDESLKALRALYLHEASRYQFFVDAEHTRNLELVREPVMTWTGTEGWSGDIFVWTLDGRPEVIGGIGSWPESGRRNIFHEFHTLASDPLPEIPIGDVARWSPAERQVELRALDGAPAPAESESLRLVQMRRLAARFEPHMQAQAGDEVLRLLPRPLYRYRSGSGDVVDGALFGYVFSTTGTDLDFVLLLECRKTETSSVWHYTPARFTRRELWLLSDGQKVWRVAWHDESPTSGRLKQPYVTLPVRTVEDTPIAPAGNE
jgi:hypothetical protein